MKNICVFCSSSSNTAPIFQSEVTRLGTLLGQNGFNLVYGGAGNGLMGLLADACLEAGGNVHGIIPEQFNSDSEKPHRGLSEFEVVKDFFERKRRMMEVSDAFVVFPGGIGTLDEAIEMICYRQVGNHNKPILFLNTLSFWDSFLNFIPELKEQGMISQPLEEMYLVAESVEETMKLLRDLSIKEKG